MPFEIPIHRLQVHGTMAAVWRPTATLRGAIIPTPRQQGIDEESDRHRGPSQDLGATAQARVCARWRAAGIGGGRGG